MKFVLLPALFVIIATATIAAEPAKAPLAIAVFEFQSPEESVRDLGTKVSTLLGAEFAADTRFISVERAELDKALGEQELGLSGTISQESAAKVGQLTGARLLVTGRVMKADRDTIIVAKLIGTETSRVFAEKATLTPTGSMADTVAALEKKLAALALENATALVATTEDPGAQIARLKQSLEGKPRKAVSVSIPEQHFGRPVVDPAAETELSLLLKECGFSLVDAKSAIKPDVEIVGEAFSERGLQKGNLIGCRARVEVKVRRLSDGVILSADRQVGVAVDLAEHVAAKSALQSAARALADRVIPAVAN
jgi:hypothetical protein